MRDAAAFGGEIRLPRTALLFAMILYAAVLDCSETFSARRNEAEPARV